MQYAPYSPFGLCDHGLCFREVFPSPSFYLRPACCGWGDFVLYALSISLSVIVLIGITVLAGVVVNNAIVLVDNINRLRQDGLSEAKPFLRRQPFAYAPS